LTPKPWPWNQTFMLGTAVVYTRRFLTPVFYKSVQKGIDVGSRILPLFKVKLLKRAGHALTTPVSP
jgi:hypothetical protein